MEDAVSAQTKPPEPIHSLRLGPFPPEAQTLERAFAGSPDERIIDPSFDLLRSLIAEPDLAEQLPHGATVAVIPDYDPEVARINLVAARRTLRQGKDVHFHFVGRSGPLEGTEYRFIVDLRDERWGAGPRPEFGAKTAAEMRALFHRMAEQSIDHEPVSMAYENVVVLNGVRAYIVDEVEPGLYSCIAIAREP